MRKRIQGFTVTPECFAGIVKANRTIPESAEFSHAYFDNERNCFVCLFEDEAFEAVPEGCRFPIDVEYPKQQPKMHQMDAIDIHDP